MLISAAIQDILAVYSLPALLLYKSWVDCMLTHYFLLLQKLCFLSYSTNAFILKMANAIYRHVDVRVTCYSMHYLPTAFGLRTGILFAKLD